MIRKAALPWLAVPKVMHRWVHDKDDGHVKAGINDAGAWKDGGGTDDDGMIPPVLVVLRLSSRL